MAPNFRLYFTMSHFSTTALLLFKLYKKQMHNYNDIYIYIYIIIITYVQYYTTPNTIRVHALIKVVYNNM